MFKYISFKSLFLLAFTVSSISSYSVLAQESQKDSLKLLEPSDYGQWESIRGSSISKDGKWVTYKVVTQDRDNTTHLYNTSNKEVVVFPNTSGAYFSNDSKWLSFTKVPTGKEAREKIKSKSKKRAPIKKALYNLISKDTLEFEGFQSIVFSDIGSFAAMKRADGNTLIIRNLEKKTEVSFGNVSAFSWQNNSTMLAMIVNTKDKVGNAIQIYNPKTSVLKVLDQKNVNYSQLQWLKDSDELFAVRKFEDKSFENETFHLLLWKNLNSRKSSFHIFDQSKFDNFPKDTRLLSSGISVSEDANSVYFSTFNWINKESKTEKSIDKKDSKVIDKNIDKEDAPEVEVWNSKDLVIIPAQKKSKMQDIATPFKAVWHVEENKFVVLSSSLVERVQMQLNNKIIVGLDRTPYDFEAMFGRPSFDAYTINSKTGVTDKVLEGISKAWNVSPNNRYFTYLKNNNIHLYDISKRVSTNITEGLDGVFINFGDDHPVAQKSAFGFAAWNKNSKSFFINSKYNVWQIYTNGSLSRKITNGEKEKTVYRITKLSRDQKDTDASKPMYFSMKGALSKKTGFAKGVAGKTIQTLLYEDASIYRMSSKLKDSDRLLILKQTYQESPNLYLTNTKFQSPLQVSNTNSFQKDFAWGRAELVSYENALGKQAQGILYYPANYKKGEKYPMITYIYEKLSQGFHRYRAPNKYDYYNTTVWTQNGYFVFNPDIDFIAGEPGISSTKTLENAVKSVVNKGDVDASKVGLIGHSWGGYQAGFVPTQTNIFAASVAGAGLTDLVAMNLAITPAFGGRPENDHFEIGQERMNSAPWVSPDNYIRNSSVMQIEKLNTPMLFEVGDNDMNVNWSQGIAYYNAARRAGKPFVLLVYAKEGHGLRQNKNKHDYQQRILKWFGHYLKGDKPETWMLEGFSYKKQQEVLKNWNK